jgi:predicted Zn-dependent protease
MSRLLAATLLMAFATGCATTSLPPATSKDLSMEVDERDLWAQSREIRQAMERGGFVYRDEALDGYLNGVVRKLHSGATLDRIPFEVMVVKDPSMNAFALPDGAMYIHLGILARMENEAQLATLLAHETTHSTHRHSIRTLRTARNKSALYSAIFGGGGPAGAAFGWLGTMASVSGYQREMEAEADTEGMRLIVEAGYDPQEAVRLFSLLKRNIEEEKIEEPYFFASHPKVSDRIDNFDSLVRTRYAGATGMAGGEAFRAAVKPALLESALLDLQRGRFQSAQNACEKFLAGSEGDPKGHYVLGEVYRQKGEEGSVEKACGEYRRAIELNPSYPDPYRSLGMIHYKQGNKDIAREHLGKYLTLAPQAQDRGYVEQYMKPDH